MTQLAVFVSESCGNLSWVEGGEGMHIDDGGNPGPSRLHSVDSKPVPPSTRGRGRTVSRESGTVGRIFSQAGVTLCFGDALDHYAGWAAPTTIVSDGGYGVLGFDGDTSDHFGLPEWYERHVEAWSRHALPETSLWFWNSEIGWAAVHPVLERHGWRYVECCMWNKGKGHIAGNVNTQNIRRFPVVTEVCALYVREVTIGGLPLKTWLLNEWKRTGLPLRAANEACGVKDAAVRKYLDKGHLWYFPPEAAFQGICDYANTHGDPGGRPYFSRDGEHPLTSKEWSKLRSKFRCPHGWTNVWDRPAVHGSERVKAENGRAAHLNQKPLDLMSLTIAATTEPGDMIWEPFGGLFSATLAAYQLDRRAFAAEVDAAYYRLGVERVEAELRCKRFEWPSSASVVREPPVRYRVAGSKRTGAPRHLDNSGTNSGERSPKCRAKADLQARCGTSSMDVGPGRYSVASRYGDRKPQHQGHPVAKNERTSKKVASIASKILSNPNSTAAQKSAAASALTQARDKPKGKK